MSKHTPGPWHASGNGVHKRKGTVGLCVAVAHDPDDPSHCTDSAIANARLIAAAPDLLAACENLIERYEFVVTYTDSPISLAVSEARAAIAKAKGDGGSITQKGD